MKLKYLKLISPLIFLSLTFLCRQVSASGIPALEPVVKDDRILILAPHPDDEAIACAGVIQEALKKKARIKIVYLTNGDHNQLAFIVYEKRLVFRKGEFIHMGEVRRQEAQKAMIGLGLKQEDLIFLGYPDFGTFAMWTRYWASPKPFKSLLTRMTKVPYPENYSYGRDYIPQNILSDLQKIIENYRPNKIFVSHPADTNGDHRSLNLFLSVAMWNLEGKIPRPRIYAYLVHHTGWPLKRKYHPDLDMPAPEDLKDAGRWLSLALEPKAVEKKYNAIGEYKSQTQSSAFYLFSFARKNELFQRFSRIRIDSSSTPNPASSAEYALKDNYLEILCTHPADNHDVSRMRIYVFGYREDIDFGDMPKIFIKVNTNSLIVFDGRKRLEEAKVELSSKGQNALIRIPLELLNNPRKALISARIFSNAAPYAQGIWLQAELEREK